METITKERPILFSAPMVRAIREGRKTQTRRVFSPERMVIEANPPRGFCYETFALRKGELVSTGMGPFYPNHWLHYCPYGAPGDRLIVRETWGVVNGLNHVKPSDLPRDIPIIYRATSEHPHEPGMRWRPAIHMPRWASRITLEVVSVRVERLQEISPADAISEGVERRHSDTYHGFYKDYMNEGYGRGCTFPNDSFKTLWQSINGPDSWALNPWVWVIEFKRINSNENGVTA